MCHSYNALLGYISSLTDARTNTKYQRKQCEHSAESSDRMLTKASFHLWLWNQIPSNKRNSGTGTISTSSLEIPFFRRVERAPFFINISKEKVKSKLNFFHTHLQFTYAISPGESPLNPRSFLVFVSIYPNKWACHTQTRRHTVLGTNSNTEFSIASHKFMRRIIAIDIQFIIRIKMYDVRWRTSGAQRNTALVCGI